VSGLKQPPTEIGSDRSTSTSAPILRRLVHLLARQAARETVGAAAIPESSFVRDPLHHDGAKADQAISSDSAIPPIQES